MQPLTQRQDEVWRFVATYQQAEQRPPTVREIGEVFDIRSPNGVMCHLVRLKKKGYIELRGGSLGSRQSSRCIRILVWPDEPDVVQTLWGPVAIGEAA